jgi:hypothetical protein
MATLASAWDSLKAPYALVDQGLHEGLVWDSTALGCVLRAAKQFVWNAKRDLRGRLIESFKDLTLKRLVAQTVKRVRKGLTGWLRLHLLILRMIRFDASRTWIGYRPVGWLIQITTSQRWVAVLPITW